jgi:hypothetical protein
MTLSSRMPSFISPSFWIDGIININGFGCVSRSAPVPTIATVLFLLLQKRLMISRVMIRPFSTDIIRNRRSRCCAALTDAVVVHKTQASAVDGCRVMQQQSRCCGPFIRQVHKSDRWRSRSRTRHASVSVVRATATSKENRAFLVVCHLLSL